MRALKLLVVVMGGLIVAGLVVIVATIASRAARGPAAEAPRRFFGETVVDLPAGAVLADRQVVGDRLVLTIALPDGAHRLLVLEPGTGTVVGTVELRPAPKP